MKAKVSQLPIGRSMKVNVALQRPTVNIKEAENQGEQAMAAARSAPLPTFSKHGTFGPAPDHTVEKMWSD